MLRSLHMKLVLIMTLLVLCLMTIAGAFLINSVNRFYLNSFYTQMMEMFGQDTDFVGDLVTQTQGETDGAAALSQVLAANMGALGVDGRERNYFVLDGRTGAYLAGSNKEKGRSLEMTPNLLIALNQKTEGSRSDPTAAYMDLAIPIHRGEEDYIIYILDERGTVRQLNHQLVRLIVESLVFGLVISVLLSFLLSRAMVTSIRALTKGARRVAEGEFTKIQVESHDEIGILTDTFNTMADRLQTTLREVDRERTKLSTLFLHMTDGVVAFHRGGGVIHANPAAQELLGMPIPLEGGVRYEDLFGDILPLEEALSLEGDCFEGEALWGEKSLLLFLAPFDREKKDGGVLVVLHDVTQQVKNETTRREFVANVSHELRTPLTNIRTYAETLSENPDLPPDMADSFLKVILGESDRMTHIVQDLLTLSRFDSGHSELRLAPFSVEEVMRDCAQAVLLDAQHRGHTLTVSEEASLPQVMGDRERILQVVMNILSNAIKYTPDGGSIHMACGQQGELVWLEVTDNGIGIPQEDREHIFERFYRVDKARSRESGGTGLGLSIAQEIIRQHEGRLTLVDRAGPGTTIRMELKTGGPGR